jgi:hypothetical protein
MLLSIKQGRVSKTRINKEIKEANNIAEKEKLLFTK